MDSALLEQLSPLSRLALSYAPAGVREDWLTLLALDAKLAGIVRQAREETLARIRLAWWRERLQAPAAERPKGEPLLTRLALWPQAGARLQGLVDGWEALLGEAPLSVEALEDFAAGRQAAVAALAQKHGLAAPVTALVWSYADLAQNLSHPAERQAALDLLEGQGKTGRLPRAFRPLAVLEGVSRRGATVGHPRPLDLLAAMRLGLLGL